MSITTFKNGASLIVGDDAVADYFDKFFNRKNQFERSCKFCRHNNTDSELCDGCSIQDTDLSCSCHIDPPCYKCTHSNFQATSNLINYKMYRLGKNGASTWECFATNSEIFNKCETTLELEVEELSTGEYSLTITKPLDELIDIQIIESRYLIPKTFEKMIENL